LEGKRLMATTRELRSIDELRERRTRNAGTIDRMQELKMAIPEKARQEYGDLYDFRWINDVGMRLHNKTEYDTWQKVPDVAPLTVGVDDDKNPIKAYLCIKPKEFVREDRAARDRGLLDIEQGLVAGATQESELQGTSYVPENTRNRIGRVTAT
jgi:hypothetical protein